MVKPSLFGESESDIHALDCCSRGALYQVVNCRYDYNPIGVLVKAKRNLGIIAPQNTGCPGKLTLWQKLNEVLFVVSIAIHLAQILQRKSAGRLSGIDRQDTP